MTVTEKEVVRLWQEIPCGRELVGEDGEPVKVLYPGRPNDERGADFRDAVIHTGKGIKKGSIEIHVWSADWRHHNHHLDTAYNNVALHVALEGKGEANCILPDGEKIPLVILERNQNHSLDEDAPLCTKKRLICSGVAQHISDSRIMKVLEQAGEARFANKAERMRQILNERSAEQCLYLGVMEALGYSKNKEQFLKLASLMPVSFLQAESRDITEDEHCLVLWQALLLGTAGLLPSQRHDCDIDVGNDVWIQKLESEWVVYRDREAMSCQDWEWFKVRPQNHPVRRIAAISYLLLRYRQWGWLEGLSRIIDAYDSEICLKLIEAVQVDGDGYWIGRYDFGLTLSVPQALLGRGRAAEIAVNAILPFCSAWNRRSPERRLENRALEIYLHFPRLPVNSIEKHMVGQLGLSKCAVNRACRQQGLIYIYKEYCIQGGCGRCPLRAVCN